MKWLMRKCVKCGQYTMKETCQLCGGTTKVPHPAKFSPDDRYASFRIETPARAADNSR